MANNTNNKNFLDKLKKSILSKSDKKSFDNLQNIDSIVNKVSSNITSDRDVNLYSRAISNLLSKNVDSDLIQKEFGESSLSTMDNVARFQRYLNAEDITENIPHCSRALKVLSDSIKSPDDISKDFINVYSNSNTEESKESKTNIESMKDNINIEDEVGDVIHDTLKYGDQFVEICDYSASEIPIVNTLISEGQLSKNEEKSVYDFFDLGNISIENTEEEVKINYTHTNDSKKKNKEVYNENLQVDEVVQYILEEESNLSGKRNSNKINIKFNLTVDAYKYENKNTGLTEYTTNRDFSELITESNNKKKKSNKKDDISNFQNIKLLTHDPRKVIKIQSKRYKMNLGYLVFPDTDDDSISRYGQAYNYTQPTSQATSVGTTGFYGTSSTMMGGMNAIDDLYEKLLGVLGKYVGKNKKNDKDLNLPKGELEDLINKLLDDIRKTSNFRDDETVNIRYVPPDNMEHFTLPNRQFFPYGEGILHKTTFAAKLLIALETALTMKRINDSIDSRLIHLEASEDRQVRNYVSKIREEFSKKKICMGDFGNVGTIPNMLTSQETFYIPQKNGKRFVEIDRLPASGQVQQLTDELKFYRDNLVSAISVPPAFINIEENLCLYEYSSIAMVDGTTITLKELIERFEKGEELEVFSYDSDVGVVFPNKVKWAGKTRLNTEVVKVWLDNDEYLITTPDHKFMLRDGTFKQAKDLEPDESLMPYEKQLNHKVKKVEFLENKVDTGDITVESNYHNFATGAGVFVHNSNKAALGHESAMFAETIISYQQILKKPLRSLISKIYLKLFEEKMDEDIVVSFPPPKSLQIERFSERIDYIRRIVEAMEEWGVPKEHVLNKFLDEDWDEIEKLKKKQKIDELGEGEGEENEEKPGF